MFLFNAYGKKNNCVHFGFKLYVCPRPYTYFSCYITQVAGLSPLESNYNFTKENPSVLNYTFPKLINAKDKYGEIELYQTFDAKCSIDVYEYSIISVIEYSFTKSMPLMDAVAKIAAARSLFSFFGNGYVAFGSITFEDDMEETKYILHLNCKEKVPAVNEPFLITPYRSYLRL